MAAGNSVLVLADASRGLTGSARELLALARSLADAMGGAVAFMPFAASADEVAADATAAGADRICACAAAREPGYHPEAFAAAALAACSALNPRVVVLGHGPFGVDLAPRVAFALGARWATQCVAARMEEGLLVCQRNEVGGKVQVLEAIEGQAVVTLRPKSVDALPPQSDRPVSQFAVEAPAPAPAAVRGGVAFVERVAAEGGAAAQLEQAEMIVTGGLGIGSAEGFGTLQELAGAMGACLGGSKQAVDRGWIAADRQVGLTGTTVAPKVYLAVAVSGALQHMAGCQKSKAIVAINKDPEAPIFRFARYGVVGTWEEVVPALLARLPPAAR